VFGRIHHLLAAVDSVGETLSYGLVNLSTVISAKRFDDNREYETLSATSVTFSVTVFPTTGEECNWRAATTLREMEDLVSVARNIVSFQRL